MNRTDAAREVKTRYAEYLKPAKKRNTYICPLCGNGTGKDGDGIAIDPHSDGTQLKCFKCGFYGDVIDIYQQEHNCTTGEAFRGLYDYFGITIDGENDSAPTEPRRAEQRINTLPKEKNAAEGQTEATEAKPDFTTYYENCKRHISDAAAREYLSFRGISEATADRYMLGYDPDTRFLIIPCARSFYVARNTDRQSNFRYKNPTGVSIELFNAAALYNEAARPVFITEGAINALSIIEAGGKAIALNSASNTRKLLDALREKRTSSTLILCQDNDTAGENATAALADGLRELNIPYEIADICGQHNDPNDALTADRAAFTDAVTTTEQKARFPGLLTPERAARILKEVNDEYLKMKQFPRLSSMVKIKTHDTVVIAADTGAGKSSLALNFLHELQDRYPALYINLEMDEATILQRLVSIHTGIELDKIEGYNKDPNTREEVDAAINEIIARREIQLLTDTYDLAEIEQQIKRATLGRTEPTIVFIDTGLLIKAAGKTASRYERFTEISEELRRIARLNNIILFVLLQQNRAGKQDEGKPPTNSSLKESGSWENDATKILFLWHNTKTESKELTITKNRSGRTGSISLNYAPHTQTYSEAQGSFIRDDNAPPFEDDKLNDLLARAQRI